MAMVGGAMAVNVVVVLAVPPTLVATAVNVTGPAVSVSELQFQLVPDTVGVQNWPPGASKVTEAPAVTVPLTVGVVLVRLFGAGTVMAMVGGATAVNVVVVLAVPPTLAATAVNVTGPAVSVSELQLQLVPETVGIQS